MCLNDVLHLMKHVENAKIKKNIAVKCHTGNKEKL